MRLQERGRSAAGSRETTLTTATHPTFSRAHGGWHWRRSLALPLFAWYSSGSVSSADQFPDVVSVCAGRRIVPRLGGVQDQAKQRAGPGAPRSGAGGWDTAMPGTLHSPSSRAILSKLCADLPLCDAGGSLPLRRPASAVRMAGKRGSSFNLARLVDDGPYPAEGSEHNADLVRTQLACQGCWLLS